MQAHSDYHIAAEPDVANKANRSIWFYFIILAAMLSVTIFGLVIMYRFQVDYEQEKKVGEVQTLESLEQVIREHSYLSGKRGLFEGKHHVSVDDAIQEFLSEVRKAQ